MPIETILFLTNSKTRYKIKSMANHSKLSKIKKLEEKRQIEITKIVQNIIKDIIDNKILQINFDIAYIQKCKNIDLIYTIEQETNSKAIEEETEALEHANEYAQRHNYNYIKSWKNIDNYELQKHLKTAERLKRISKIANQRKIELNNLLTDKTATSADFIKR